MNKELTAFPDAGRAFWRAGLLHLPMSVPFAVGALIVPRSGRWYLRWREREEQRDQEDGSDSGPKAAMDLWSQTVLVRAALKVRGAS